MPKLDKKKWSFKFDKCIKCKSKKYPHRQDGYCVRCWAKKRYQKDNDYFKNYYKSYYKKNKEKILANGKKRYKKKKELST